MKFSQSVDLAIHSLWYMATNTPDQPIMIKDLAKKLRASESYLARVMLWLAKADLLKSIRGKKGGFVFKKAPDEITIADVIIAIDSDTAEYSCSWEERGCNQSFSCSLVQLFQEAREQMLAVLRTMTIADIARKDGKPTVRSEWLVPIQPGPISEEDSSEPSSQRVAL